MGYWGVKILGYGILGVQNLGYWILGGKTSGTWDMGTPVSPPLVHFHSYYQVIDSGVLILCIHVFLLVCDLKVIMFGYY